MCIAILNTKVATLKKEALKNCWLNNGDGAGILYIDNGVMKTSKELMSFDVFYETYVQIKKSFGKKNNILIHFRISTHGLVNESNCHPFLVDDNIGFIHNGMIYNIEDSKLHSDTYMFNENILKNLKPGFEYKADIMDMLADFIGKGSKLVFLNAQDEYCIVNEEAGHWYMGCWFSNRSYEKVNNYIDYGGVKKYKTFGAGYAGKSGGYATPASQDAWIGGQSWYSADTEFCDTCACKLYSTREKEEYQCVSCRIGEEETIARNKRLGLSEAPTQKVDPHTFIAQHNIDTPVFAEDRFGTCSCCQEIEYEEHLQYAVDFNMDMCRKCTKEFLNENGSYKGDLGA